MHIRIKLFLIPPWENPIMKVGGELLKIYYKHMQLSTHISSLHTLSNNLWLGKNVKTKKRLLT